MARPVPFGGRTVFGRLRQLPFLTDPGIARFYFPRLQNVLCHPKVIMMTIRCIRALGCLFTCIVFTANMASAVLITTTVNQQITAEPDGPNQIFDLDVDQNGTTDLTFRSIIGDTTDPTFASFADIVPPFGTPNGVVVDSFTGDGFPTVSLLQPGDVVSPTSLFSGPNDDGNLSSQIFPDGPTGNFQDKSGFVGFQFQGTDGIHFGFAQISVNDLLATQNPLAIFISTVSYESVAGQAVTVSAVPEPASLFLMCLGVSTICWRRIGHAR